MKQTSSLLLGLVVMILSIGFIPTSLKAENFTNNIYQKQITGHWVINSFGTEGEENAGQYSTYTFDFFSDGSITITNGDEHATGSYVQDRDNMTLNFPDVPMFEIFNGVWSINVNNEDNIVLFNADGKRLSFTQVYFYQM